MVCAPPPHLSMSAPGSPISNFFPPRGARLSQASLNLIFERSVYSQRGLRCPATVLSFLTSQRHPRRLGLSAPVGALVKSIKAESPAALAGIQVGDVIVGGVAPPPGDTLWEQSRFIARDGRLRNLVLNEPRGGVFRHVNLLVPPKHPEAQAAQIRTMAVLLSPHCKLEYANPFY